MLHGSRFFNLIEMYTYTYLFIYLYEDTIASLQNVSVLKFSITTIPTSRVFTFYYSHPYSRLPFPLIIPTEIRHPFQLCVPFDPPFYSVLNEHILFGFPTLFEWTTGFCFMFFMALPLSILRI